MKELISIAVLIADFQSKFDGGNIEKAVSQPAEIRFIASLTSFDSE